LKVQFYTPHLLLQEFINCIMIVHAELGPDEPSICIYPPTPQNSLFFYLNDSIKMNQEGKPDFLQQPRSVIVGPQLTRVTLDINRSHKAVRVGFHPGGLYRLLGISMCGMIDESYDATDVFGAEMKEINDRLQEDMDFDQIHQIIEGFLLKKVSRLKTALPFDKAMLALLHYNGNIPMDKIASLSCLSLRQFERISKERIGIPPKLFARLTRFSKAYRMHEQFSGLNWTAIAHECGYFDQMHFIRDFKEFAGVTPRIIAKEVQDSPVRMQAALKL
jgi:AraC-like DNA-binding protein